jgi:4-hydroxy-4-methyl-2-oxoglutarate aldolase
LGIEEEFAKWPTGNIADALSAMGHLAAINYEIRPIFRPISLVGRALTIKVERTKRKQDGQDIATVAKENSKRGDVIVLACGGYDYGDQVLWGENSMTACQVRGAVGAVIDGGCRDAAALTRLGIPVFTRALSPGGRQGTLYAVDYNVSVTCGGVRVEPGDLVVGDDDGVCIIPQDIEEDALRVVRLYGERDKAVAPALRAGKSVAEAYSIKKGWEKEAGLRK